MEIIGLLIPLGAAFAVYRDAENRGMNGAGWAIGVFLLLIICLPIYLITRKPILTGDEENNRDQMMTEQSNSDSSENQTLLIAGLSWVILSSLLGAFQQFTETYFGVVYYGVNSLLWGLVPFAISTAIKDRQVRTIFFALSAVSFLISLYYLSQSLG